MSATAAPEPTSCLLAIGPVDSDLLTSLRVRLRNVIHARSFAEAHRLARLLKVETVLLTPEGDGSGIELVRLLKSPSQPQLRLVPFFVMSPHASNDRSYAVVVDPPEFTFLEDGLKRPILETMLSLDVVRLLASRIVG